MDKLFYNTTNPNLLDILKHLMAVPEFKVFRLVGGTALSLQRGHRISVDIDLFTDVDYGSLDFDIFEKYLQEKFFYFETLSNFPVALGKTYYIGTNKENSIKLDMYYTDPFIENYKLVDGIRLATVNEILAMKMDVISRGGRKKDFWDVHELMEDYTLQNMVELHRKRYPCSHNANLLFDKIYRFQQSRRRF